MKLHAEITIIIIQMHAELELVYVKVIMLVRYYFQIACV